MKYKLICVDVDGTLLDDEKKLPLPVIESVRRAADKGIQIALVSGRMPAGLFPIEERLGISCIKACNAGTYILQGERCIGAEYLPNQVVKQIYETFAKKFRIPLWIYREKDWYVTDWDRFVQRESEIIGYTPQVVEVESILESWEVEKIRSNKVVFASEPDQIRKLYQGLQEFNSDEIDMAYSAPTFLEVFPRGMTKGKSLHIICDKLGISEEATIAFGDQELDIPMIEAAGMGIAMDNAIPELKSKADYVTKSNNEAGVAYALDCYLKL